MEAFNGSSDVLFVHLQCFWIDEKAVEVDYEEFIKEVTGCVIYIVLKSLKRMENFLGPNGMAVIRKFFGVILLAIAVKIFSTNAGMFGK